MPSIFIVSIIIHFVRYVRERKDNLRSKSEDKTNAKNCVRFLNILFCFIRIFLVVCFFFKERNFLFAFTLDFKDNTIT